jgi:CPA1 family monovalent cation:H+ antiporter
MSSALFVTLVLGAVIGLALVAKRLNQPYPVAFVIGGAALAFVPDVPHFSIKPDVVFLLILPPLLFGAGWVTDWVEFRRNSRAIGLLAIGLVVFTTVIVAVVAHALPTIGLPWALAFVLGAIVSPPDAIAAEAVFERLTVPNRIYAILTGESLVNDASALILYRFALVAVITGAFSFGTALAAFFVVAIGGIAVGFAVAFAIVWFYRFLQSRELDDATIVNMVSLIAPYLAYLPAEALHVSGVLSTVTAGIYLGRGSAQVLDPQSRVVGRSVWNVFTFALNGFVFIVLGLQLPTIARSLLTSPQRLALDALLISALVIIIRIVYVFPATYIPRFLSKKLRQRDPYPTWRQTMVVAWTGMRGIISLAAALAIPFSMRSPYGAHVPIVQRNEIIFITFCVIFATLVIQGCTLAPLIRWLGVAESSSREKEETEVRITALEAGIKRLRDLERTFTTSTQWTAAGSILAEYEQRIEHLRGHLVDDGDGTGRPANEIDHLLQSEALAAERDLILALRRAGKLRDEIFRNVEYDLDLADVRLR